MFLKDCYFLIVLKYVRSVKDKFRVFVVLNIGLFLYRGFLCCLYIVIIIFFYLLRYLFSFIFDY